MSGLLQRASLLSANKGLAFNSFIQKNKFTLLGIFTQYNTFYYISESIGFNGKSILKSFSTLDFWDGTIPEENKIYRFSLDDNNIYPFLQFFSEEVQETLSSLNIIKKDDKVYILGNEDFSENTVKELTKLTESQSNLSNKIFDANSIEIDFENAVLNFLEENKVEDFLNSQAKTALKNEIYNRLSLYFSKIGNIEKTSDFSAKISYDSSIDSSLLKDHLLSNLEEVLERSVSKIIWN